MTGRIKNGLALVNQIGSDVIFASFLVFTTFKMPPRRCVVQYCSRVSDKELGISVQSSLEYCKSFGLQIGYYRETKMIIRMVDTTFTQARTTTANRWLIGGTSSCHAGGHEFDSGRTNTHGLKITE